MEGTTIECLTGTVSFNTNQERDMAMGIYKWQMGSLAATLVLNWDGIKGYKWFLGANVVWPSWVFSICQSDKYF